MADIWHVRYRRLNSPVKSIDQVGSFYHMTFQNAPRWSPGTKLTCHMTAIGGNIAKCVRFNRWRKSLAIFVGDQISAYKITRCVAGLSRNTRVVCRRVHLSGAWEGGGGGGGSLLSNFGGDVQHRSSNPDLTSEQYLNFLPFLRPGL